MRDDISGEIFILLLIAIVCAFGGGAVGDSLARADMRTHAVEHGHAEWIVSPDGSTEFHWLGEDDE